MYEPFSLILRNVNIVPQETLIVGGFTTHTYGRIEPGQLIRVEVDADFDMIEIHAVDDTSTPDGYIFHSDEIVLPVSRMGNVLVWNDRDCGSVVVVLSQPLPDMTFDEAEYGEE